MELFDLQRFHKGLHAGAELAGIAVVVQAVDTQHGPIILLVHDVAHQRALEAPVVAVFHLLVDDAVGMELLGQTIRGVPALLHLLIGDVAGALGMLHDVQADLGQGVLVVPEVDDLPSGGGAKAVAVGHHQRAAALDELGQVGVVDLAAHDGNSGAEGGLGVGLAGLQLLQRLPQVGEDQLLGAGEAHQIQHVELIAGDNGVIGLTHLADLADDGADLIMLGHRLADGGVGGIHAVLLRQRLQHAAAHLPDVGIQRVVRHFVGDVAVGDKEVGLVVHLQDLKMLHGAVHHGAGIHAGQRVQKLVAALHTALHQRTGILAGVVGHIIGGDVQRACPRCAQTHGKAVAEVEQRLGHMIAGIADGQPAICLCLLHQLVVGVFQQILKVDQMLQISQGSHLFPNVFFTG